MTHTPGYQALRRGRVSIPGQVYLITTTTKYRLPIFSDWYAAQAAAKTFTSVEVLKGNQLLCWVLMPDHVHWLLQLGGSPLSEVVRHLKTHSTRAVNQQVSRTGGLWQAGYHDRAIRREDDLKAVARYIVGNPLRAGLVSSIGDYPYWDAVWI